MVSIFLSRNPSWWRRRTTLERALTFISVVAGIAVLALIIALVSVVVNGKSEGNLLDD